MYDIIHHRHCTYICIDLRGDFDDPFIDPLLVLGAVFGGRFSGGGTCFTFSGDAGVSVVVAVAVVVKFSAEEEAAFFTGGWSLSSSLAASWRSSIEWKVF